MTTATLPDRKVRKVQSPPNASAWCPAISLAEASPWLIEVFNAIGALRQLAANWDGCGSPLIREEAIGSTWRLLSAIKNEELSAPAICPVTGGGVGVRWKMPGGELDIEVHPDGTAEYLLTMRGEDGAAVSEDGPLDTDAGEQLRCLISRLRADGDRGDNASPEALPAPTEDDLVPGVEFPWVIAMPPQKAIRVRGKVRGIREPRHDLALSDAEWADLMVDEGDG